MKRTLGAEDPDLQPGISYRGSADGHDVGTAPHLLGQSEQLRQGTPERDQIEAAVDRRTQHQIAPGLQIAERGLCMLRAQLRKTGPDDPQRLAATSEYTRRRLGEAPLHAVAVLGEQRGIV